MASLAALSFHLGGCASSGAILGGATAQQLTCDGVAIEAGADLNALIEQAELGDVLCLAAGTYKAPIRIEASLTLAADGSGPVILDAGGEGTTLIANAPTGQIALRGLTIIGGRGEAVGGGLSVVEPHRHLFRRSEGEEFVVPPFKRDVLVGEVVAKISRHPRGHQRRGDAVARDVEAVDPDAGRIGAEHSDERHIWLLKVGLFQELKYFYPLHSPLSALSLLTVLEVSPAANVRVLFLRP